MQDNNCPCEAVRELKEIVAQHSEQLNRGNTQFAVINTKLNMVISIMTCIGVAIVGVVVKLIFHT